ncbi:MAG: hypothetical protein U5R49_03840 [Deltaproteobacteria bacterium]|nr:hypothetical protein [Deltaproteobacteria bacterium]
MSGERTIMEKIVIMSSESGKQEPMVAMIRALFPECRVEVVSETAEAVDVMAGERKTVTSFGERDLSQKTIK